MKIALITGASGALGPSVLEAVQTTWRPRILVRTPPARRIADDMVVGQLGSREAVTACQGVDVVIHLAALLHVVDPPVSLEHEYRRVNVEGTQHLARAARDAGVRRFVHVSTISVYGPGTHDETSAVLPEGVYARSKMDSERALVEELRGSSTEHVILRLAAVYGSNLKGNYLNLVRGLCRGTFVPIGTGSNHRTLIHQHDAGRAAAAAAAHPNAANDVFNVTDGATPSVGAIESSICRALGRRPPRLRVPAALVRGGLTAAALPFRLAGGRAPLGPWLLDKYLEDVRVSGEKLRARLAFAPEVSLDEGWKETVDGLRGRGILAARCRSFP